MSAESKELVTLGSGGPLNKTWKYYLNETPYYRVLARPGMTPAKFDQLLARQISDAAKRTLADFVIDSSRGLDSARAQVAAILAALKARDKN